MVKIGNGVKIRRRHILVARSVAGLLAVPPITIYLFLQIYYYTFQGQIDDDLFSMTFAFSMSPWNQIIIIIIGLPYHIYFVKQYKTTLMNYIILGLSIGMIFSIIWIIMHYEFFRPFDVMITLLTCVLNGVSGGIVFWFVVFWPHDVDLLDQWR